MIRPTSRRSIARYRRAVPSRSSARRVVVVIVGGAVFALLLSLRSLLKFLFPFNRLDRREESELLFVEILCRAF